MGTSYTGGKMDFEVNLGRPAARVRPEPDEPFRVAVLGDLSGRANRVVIESLSARKFRRVDIDSLDQVLGSIGAALKIPLGSDTIDLRFATLDDFHPDRLVRDVAPLKGLLALRRKAVAGAPVAELAQELRGFTPMTTATIASSSAAAESGEQTLARLLGGAPAGQPKRPETQAAAAVEEILRKAVAGSAVPAQSAERQAAVTAVDLELSKLLRAILHHPGFQALEASWRGIDFLVRTFGGEENIELFAADIAQHELAAEVAATESAGATGIFKLLRSVSESQPLALCLGLYEFGVELSEVRLLSFLAAVADRLSVPFIAQARPWVVGCKSFGAQRDPDDWRLPLAPEFIEAWNELRRRSEAAYVALSLPRFLIRQPYGAQSEPIESFPFEELQPASGHEDYLWGNPAIACGHVLARRFQEEGWTMGVEGWGELDGLPVHSFVSDGEKQVKPCAEAWLSDRAGEVLQGKGLVPLLSIKGRDAARVGRLQSIHEPPAALRGQW
jgi:type VI secretion system protein ImpC